MTTDVAADLQAGSQRVAGRAVGGAGDRWRTWAVRTAAVAMAVAAVIGGAVSAAVTAPPTVVPQTIAGSRVTAQLELGTGTTDIRAFGHRYVKPLDARLLGQPVGVRITFDTTDLTVFGRDGSLDPRAIDPLVSMFADPTPQRREIESALRHDLAVRAALGALLPLAVSLVLGGLYAHRRRQLARLTPADRRRSVREWAVPRGVVTVALALAAVAQVVPAARVLGAPEHAVRLTGDPAFEGTPLAGGHLSGPFSAVLLDLLPAVRQLSAERNAYIRSTSEDLQRQFVARYGTQRLAQDSHVKRVMFLEDPQGIDVVLPALGDAARRFRADAIVVGGDITSSGLPLETNVLDALKAAAGDLPVVVYLGRHDSADVARLARERGFHVVDGAVHTYGGIPFLGANDPGTIPALGLTPRLADRSVTPDTVATALADAVRAAEVKPVVVVHDKTIGTKVAEAGPAAVLTGQQYTASPPFTYGSTAVLVAGSGGGHGANDGLGVYGLPANPAHLYLVELDATTFAMTSVTHLALPAGGSGGVVLDEPVRSSSFERRTSPGAGLNARVKPDPGAG